jgi:hypothetical protein
MYSFDYVAAKWKDGTEVPRMKAHFPNFKKHGSILVLESTICILFCAFGFFLGNQQDETHAEKIEVIWLDKNTGVYIRPESGKYFTSEQAAEAFTTWWLSDTIRHSLNATPGDPKSGAEHQLRYTLLSQKLANAIGTSKVTGSFLSQKIKVHKTYNDNLRAIAEGDINLTIDNKKYVLPIKFLITLSVNGSDVTPIRVQEGSIPPFCERVDRLL